MGEGGLGRVGGFGPIVGLLCGDQLNCWDAMCGDLVLIDCRAVWVWVLLIGSNLHQVEVINGVEFHHQWCHDRGMLIRREW